MGNTPSKKLEKYLKKTSVLDVPDEPVRKKFPVKVIRVIDGDTIEAIVCVSKKCRIIMSIRISGVDTPEIRSYKGHSLYEKEAGLVVKKEVEKLFTVGQIVYTDMIEWDRNGGRIVADVYLTFPDGTQKMMLSEYLLENKLAKPYNGKEKKPEWTDEEYMDIIYQKRE